MKLYLIVIDTTEAFTRANLPSGILNTVVVIAEDAVQAKNNFLNQYTGEMIRKLNEAIYVYDLNEISVNLEQIQKGGGQPQWTFIPLRGGRPPRQVASAPIQMTSNGNQTLSGTIAQPPRTEGAPRPLNVSNVSNSPRSREFQPEQVSPQTQPIQDPNKLAMLRDLGVHTGGESAGEGYSPRLNSSVGRNVSIEQPRTTHSAPEGMNAEKAALLRGIGVTLPGGYPVQSTGEDVISDAALLDPSLAEIPNDAPPVIESEK